MSDLVSRVSRQQNSNFSTSVSDILILVSCVLGVFDGGLPFLGDIFTSFLFGDTFSILNGDTISQYINKKDRDFSFPVFSRIILLEQLLFYSVNFFFY